MSEVTSDLENVLAADNLGVRFGGVQALDGVSISVREHEVLAVIGPNGAGKTTLVNALTGVVKLTQGAVNFLGQDIIGLGPEGTARRGLARTFQNVGAVTGIGALDLLLLGRHRFMPNGVLKYLLPTVNKAERAARSSVLEVADYLGIVDVVRQNPSIESLPYGVRKLLDIGRAVATSPTLLLLDEPVAGLQGAELDRVRDVVERMKALGTMSLVVIEHDLGFVGAIADRVSVIAAGRPVVEGRYDDVMAHPEVLEKYIGASCESDQMEPKGAMK